MGNDNANTAKGTKITISEALSWRKTLEARYTDLVGLRNANSHTETRYYGANSDKERTIQPRYDVVGLDGIVSGLAREIRLLDMAVKRANNTVQLENYLQDDDVLGELQVAGTAIPAV